MKLTKNCLYPWNFMQIHAGGMIQCCAVANDTDLGDFIIDHCMKSERGEPSDIFNSPGLVSVRDGLLTGNLRPMCRDCFFTDTRLVSTDHLASRVKEHLRRRMPDGTDVEALDLSRSYAYDEIAISFTNRCNMSCVYCVQSTQAKSNPYFKAEFPEKYTEPTLDFIASQGIWRIRSCVEGEPTIYKRWRELFSAFFDKYPHIQSRMTTNLSREYAQDEIDLLVRYESLDVSCDTLDPLLYAKLRRGGKLSLVLDNIKRIQARAAELGISGPNISIHAVVCDLTWPTLQELSDYAFDNNMHPVLGNYEERQNSVAFQHKICRPLSALPPDEQRKAFECVSKIEREMQARLNLMKYGVVEDIQGGLIHDLKKQVQNNYNRFEPYDENPLHSAFFMEYPCGEAAMHLDVVYDHDNIAYAGVLFKQPGQKLRLGNFGAKYAVIREVAYYAAGKTSHKYGQAILPGYRSVIEIRDGIFEYAPVFATDVSQILLEVSEYWNQ